MIDKLCLTCPNHLKQFGLAVHNFHDTRNGVPPVLIWSNPASDAEQSGSTPDKVGRMSFWGLVYPYAEQQALYDLCTAGSTGTANESFDRRLDAVWWNPLDDSVKRGFGGVSIYRCPSRRGSGALFVRETTDTSPGPQTDYAIVGAYANSSTASTANTADWRYLRSCWDNTATQVNRHRGPFRVADTTVTGNRVDTWSPRDSFSRWKDRTSNQIIVAEKHIPSFALGKCQITSTAITDNNLDCSYLAASSNSGGTDTRMRADMAAHAFASNVMAYNISSIFDTNPGRPIARSDSEPTTGVARWEWAHIGSAHSGVFNVLLGDGSVRGAAKSVSSSIIKFLTIVDDGQSIQLP